MIEESVKSELHMVVLVVRTYVNHVRNICQIELANPLTKCTLLVIG